MEKNLKLSPQQNVSDRVVDSKILQAQSLQILGYSDNIGILSRDLRSLEESLADLVATETMGL